jgi:PAS domain S-box-containing protein
MANPKILIVEDDNIIAQDLQKHLSNFGYNVVGAVSTGEDAVKNVIENSPDLVLMDIRLRGEKDGIETGTVLRFQHEVSVVYLSDAADADTLKRVSTADPFGFILKPFNERELKTTITMAFYRKELERRFKENEMWYGTTLKSIGEAVISMDAKGLIKFMNTSAENLTGWKIHEVLGEDLLKVFRTKETLAKSSPINPVNQILKQKITAVLKYYATLISRDGKEMPIEESASPIKDELGNTVGVVLVFQDVSERKRVQDALKASQDYAQSIIDSSMDMVIAVDLDRRIIEFNQAAEQTFGYKKEEIIGSHISILYADPDTGVRINKQIDEIGRDVTEVMNKKKNGEVFPCLLLSSVLKNSLGEKIGYMGMSRDITEKKRIDQALLDSEERYRTLVELSPDPICVFVGGKFAFVNNAAIDIFGAETSDALLGRSMIEMVHPDYRRSLRDQFRQMAHQGNHVPIREVKFFRIDWTTFEAEVAAIPFSWQGSSAIQVVLRDITERRKAEQIIRSSEAKYRSLIENVLDGVYQTTPDGEILTANPALAQMLGYESETDLLLINIEKEIYVNSDERKQYLKFLIKGQRMKNAEFKLKRKDGQVITVLENARAVRNKLGDILYFEGTLTDISEAKLAHEAMHMSEERFHMFVQDNPIAQFIADTDGTVTDCNPAFMNMLGYASCRDVLVARINILGSTRKEKTVLLKQLKNNQVIYTHIMKLAHTSGDNIIMKGSFVAMQDKRGALLCIKGILVPESSKRRKVVKR